MKPILPLLAGLAALLSGFFSPLQAMAQWTSQPLTIYFANDLHGEIEPCG